MPKLVGRNLHAIKISASISRTILRMVEKKAGYRLQGYIRMGISRLRMGYQISPFLEVPIISTSCLVARALANKAVLPRELLEMSKQSRQIFTFNQFTVGLI